MTVHAILRNQASKPFDKALRNSSLRRWDSERSLHVDYTDGVRVLFDNGDVAHVRPSGNADELRIYAVADTQVARRRDRGDGGR